ncbi:hypothetical protein K439DRAFT_1621617 [Ramaria rubella]|nr:hypothetical protein K439DRAFT_1621617 [Ramaria rubella]
MAAPVVAEMCRFGNRWCTSKALAVITRSQDMTEKRLASVVLNEFAKMCTAGAPAKHSQLLLAPAFQPTLPMLDAGRCSNGCTGGRQNVYCWCTSKALAVITSTNVLAPTFPMLDHWCPSTAGPAVVATVDGDGSLLLARTGFKLRSNLKLKPKLEESRSNGPALA